MAGDGAPEWAYSRERDLDRFAPLVAAADALVVALVSAYEVEVIDEVPARALRGKRLTPTAGASLALAVTDYPGVLMQAGHAAAWRWPTCGCDACDEHAVDGMAEMHEVVAAVVGGTFAEEWVGAMTFWSIPGRRTGTGPAEDGRWADTTWPPWRRRPPPWEPPTT